MRAIRIERAGGPEVMALVDVPEPRPGPGEVRVRVHAIGVNFADVMGRRAIHRSMRPPPLVLGCEAAGVIDAVGEGVTRLRTGDRVGVYSPFGNAYAEALVVPEAYALPLPGPMSFDEAAAFTHLALTAHAALHGTGPVRAGLSLLVTAAAGGLGGMLLQLGRAAGLRVIAAVGSAAKVEAVRARGYRDVIDYEGESLTSATLRLTGNKGVDIAVETVGGASFAQAEAALAPLGRIVIAGMASGQAVPPDVSVLIDRSAACMTLNLSVVFAAAPERCHAAWGEVVRLYEDGLLVPRIGHRYALADVADAHRLLESRRSVDKIVLHP